MNDSKNFIVFADVKRLFIRARWIILAGAVVLGGIAFFLRSQIPLKYEVKATFKEGSIPSNVGGQGIFESLLTTIGGTGNAHQGHYLMISSLILEPVIERLGMQANLAYLSPLEIRKTLFSRAMQAEKKEIPTPLIPFEFRDVSFRSERPETYEINFTSRETFTLKDREGAKIAQGVIGEPVICKGLKFTMTKTPKQFSLNTPFSLTFIPLHELVLSLQDALKIIPVEGDRAILEITLNYPYRERAKNIVNSLMEEYQQHLKHENQRIASGQMSYLVKRQEQLCAQRSLELQEHVSYLKERLENKGALSLGHQLPLFLERKKTLTDELVTLEGKISQLKGGSPTSYFGQFPDLVGLQESLLNKRKEWDELSLALSGGRPFIDAMGAKLQTLRSLDQEKRRVGRGVDHFFAALSEKKREADKASLGVGAFRSLLSPNAERLHKVQQEKSKIKRLLSEKEKGELTVSYLDHHLHLLSVQEEILKKQLFQGIERSDEYQGVDLSAARKLLVNYVQERDGALFKIDQIAIARQELDGERADWVALSGLFPDGMSQEMVREMGEVQKLLRKERLHTQKERERLERRLSRKKEDLLKHLDQMAQVYALEKKRYEERIASVQMAILDLLGEDISLVENQIRERIEELLAHLEEEKRWAEKELGEVKKALEEVPETWLREQELQFSAEMSRSMLEGMVQLVETKNIENNLVSIESKPIDPAQASMIPKSLRLKVFGGVGFFLGGLITFAGAIIWGVLRGLPLSLENIKVRGKRVLGTLSRGSDLNLIRTCCLWVDEKKVETPIVMLLLDHRKDYSLPLANVLGKEGKRVAHLPLNFEKEKDRSPSLAHYLGGEVKEPIFVERSFGHTIPIGGGSYTEEILKSKKLPPFIETLKQSYDVILFSIPSSPKETLPKHLFPFANHLILTLGNASYEDLIPYFAWEQEGHHLAFIH